MLHGQQVASGTDHGLAQESGHRVQALAGLSPQYQMKFFAHESLLGFPWSRQRRTEVSMMAPFVAHFGHGDNRGLPIVMKMTRRRLYAMA
ncbi:hypothetical protein JCM14713_31470 [Desulfomicrobium salsuginis]